MNKILILTALLFTVIFSSSSYAKITHCEGEYKSKDSTEKIEIDVIHSMKNECSVITLRDPDTFKFKEFLNDADLVGEGFTEIKKELFKVKRHRFIITSLGEGNSLVGIYFHNFRTYTLWAELWSEEKPFAFFDTFNGKVLRGNCR
jgi:hypothetical protein